MLVASTLRQTFGLRHSINRQRGPAVFFDYLSGNPAYFAMVFPVPRQKGINPAPGGPRPPARAGEDDAVSSAGKALAGSKPNINKKEEEWFKWEASKYSRQRFAACGAWRRRSSGYSI